jgi:hypothetical protein
VEHHLDRDAGQTSACSQMIRQERIEVSLAIEAEVHLVEAARSDRWRSRLWII